MKRYALLLLLLLPTGICLANEPHDVLQAFSKVEASVETGVTLRDYTRAVGELNYAYKSYAETPGAAKQPAIRTALSAALFRYIWAGELWNLKTAGIPRIAPGTEAYKLLAADYPDALKDYNHGGAASNALGGELNVDFLLPFLWSDAAASIHAAKAAAARP